MARLDEFADKILKLPSKKRYTKQDLLTSDFLIDKRGDTEIFYSPHNEYINERAKILIIGITPGWSQMERAVRHAKTYLEQELPANQILKMVKQDSGFAGSMRTNLIQMLNDVLLPYYFNIHNASIFFDRENEYLHTVSLVKYPVMVKGQNYTGHLPILGKSAFLLPYVYKTLHTDILPLKNPLIIPLGKAVEEIIMKFIKEGYITEQQCLLGFPHPSGANGHRHRQFNEKREMLVRKIEDHFLK